MLVAVWVALIAAWLGAMHWSLMLPEGSRQPWRVFIYALIGAPFAYLFMALCLWLMDPTQSHMPFVAYLSVGINAVVLVALVAAVATYRYRHRFYPPEGVSRAVRMAAGLRSSILLLVVLAILGTILISVTLTAYAPDRVAAGSFIGTALAILLFSLAAFFIIRDLKGADRDAHAGLMAGTFVCLAATGFSYLGALSHING